MIKFDKTKSLFIIGLSFYWLLLRHNSVSSLFLSPIGTLDGATVHYSAAMVIASVFILIFLIYRERLTPILHDNRKVIPILGIVASILSTFGALIPYSESIALLLALFRDASIGVILVLLTLSWSKVVAYCFDRSTLLLVSVSFFISIILNFLILLPAPYGHIVMVLSPAISSAAVFLCLKEQPRTIERSLSSLKRLPLGMVFILALFLLLGSLSRGLLYSHGTTFSSPEGPVWTNGISSIFAVFIITAIMASKSHKRILYIIWAVFAVIYMTGVFLGVSYGTGEAGIGPSCIIAGRTCLNFLLFVTLVAEVHRKGISLVGAVSIFLLTETASALLTYYVFPRMFELPFVNEPVMFSLTITLMLIVGSFAFMLSDSFRNAVQNDSSKVLNADNEFVYSQIAEEYKLTARETEILKLIPLGHSGKKIGELLYISPNTVTTHTKSIYRKMGIHRKQELIDYINETRKRSN